MSNQCQINWSVRLISLTKGKISTKNAVITSSCLFFFFSYFSWPLVRGILVPQSGIKLTPSALEAQSLNHWTTSPELLFFVVLFNDIVLVIIPSMQKANTFLSGY